MMAWIALIGPFFIPLLICSVLVAAGVFERSYVYLRTLGLGAVPAPTTEPGQPLPWRQVELLAQAAPPLAREGLQHLLALRAQPRAVREEVLGVWLEERRQALLNPLRWLSLAAGIAPMLGLLGTVTGMIRAFHSVADHSGPVTPGLLAGGLWEALLTTAVGLGVALPATVAAHIFRGWAQTGLHRTLGLLNRVNLALEGIPALAANGATHSASQSAPADDGARRPMANGALAAQEAGE